MENHNRQDLLLTVIVNSGQGTKVLHFAKEHGISGGTVIMARGTVCNRFLTFLGICELRKEMIVMVGEKTRIERVLRLLKDHFHMSEKHKGIGFTTKIVSVEGLISREREVVVEQEMVQRAKEKNQMSDYNSITVIVEKGNGEAVVEAGIRAGSKGATVLNARGSGIHETSKVFSMEIEPEKEMVMILSKKETTPKIVQEIKSALKIDEPGKGIIYVQEVVDTVGLFE